MFGEATRDALALVHLLQASGTFLFVVTAPPAGAAWRASACHCPGRHSWRALETFVPSSNSLVSVAIARRVDYGKAEENSCCYRV